MDQETADDQKQLVLALDGETHTLGNTLRDVMWAHPHVELASYTQEHPSMQEIILRCQTTGAISAEQGVVEALHMTKMILGHMADTMEGAAARWEAQQQQQGGGSSGVKQQQQQQQQRRPAADAMDEDS